MTQALVRLCVLSSALWLLAGCGAPQTAPALTEPASEPPPAASTEINPPSMAIHISDQGEVSEAGTHEAGALIERGERVYQRQCGACHSLDQNRVGPMHRGVIGRAAGTVPGYRYSRALQGLDLVWTDETLDAWLQNPSQMARGTAMGFRLQDAADRAAVIAYLESVSE